MLIFALAPKARAEFNEQTDRKSLFFAPLANYFIPGTSQIYYGQYAEGAAHLGIFGSLTLGMRDQARSFSKEETKLINKADSESYEFQQLSLYNKHFLLMESMRGLRITNRGISVYSAFRDGVDSYKDSGEFDFLGERETTADLLLAPVHFEHVSQPTTWLYLLAQSASAYFQMEEQLKDSDKYEHASMHGYHVGTRLVLHYGAGVGEETVYRGWLMPFLQEKSGNRWVANLVQSAAFGAMHGDNFGGHALFGFYQGWVVQRNRGRLSESIFAHAWGNMIGQVASYMVVRSKAPEAARNIRIWLPELTIPF